MAILSNPYPTFQPAMRVISSITNAYPAAVTTTINHQYQTGIIARLNIPLGFGMTQANGMYGSIVVTGDTTFTIDIDTTHFDAFLAPVTYPLDYQYAQVTPMGEINQLLSSATRNVLPYPG